MPPPGPTPSPPDEVAAITALGEPTRRAVYDRVVAAGDWVGRDAVAGATGLERATAAHHLDRLARDGLLEVDYRRLSGRSGPGAGRPAKVYRRSDRDFDVSLPPRHYELAGQLLAEAAERSRSGGIDIDTALGEVAAEEGRRLSEAIADRAGGEGSASVRRRGAVVEVLRDHGFEPSVDDDGTVTLRNCPFHRLAQSHTELICGMNHCLLTAALVGASDAGLEARLEPTEGQCCVRLHPVG